MSEVIKKQKAKFGMVHRNLPGQTTGGQVVVFESHVLNMLQYTVYT
jgi:hypothetical protein